MSVEVNVMYLMRLFFCDPCIHATCCVNVRTSFDLENKPLQGRIQDFLKRGEVHLRATSKKRGGGSGGSPTLGPMLKSLHRGTKRGVRTPWTPPPQSAHPVLKITKYREPKCFYILTCLPLFSSD